MKFPGIFMVSVLCLATACKSRTSHTSLFQLIPAQQSQITFENRLIENDSINPFDVTNMYNGAGVVLVISITTAWKIFISRATRYPANSISTRVI
jgi:hypothetical protein